MTNPRRESHPPLFEAEVIPGLESFAIDELHSKFGANVAQVNPLRAGFIRFRFSDRAQLLLALRSVIAVYQVHHFLIPRPKAFLGHEHFARLTRILSAAAQSFPQPPRSMGIGAAGARSSVMRRLLQELLDKLNLARADDGKGELFIRLLPKREAAGWELLVRISPYALSAREYRVVNMPGSLNATAAYAMTQVEKPDKGATVVNLCSGASTILIELALNQPQYQLVAIDCSETALRAGARNASASGRGHCIRHIRADVGQAPLPSNSVDRLYADPPFGHHIGSHETNRRLYPAILQEADRLARTRAAFIVLTHEVKLLRRCLQESPWSVASETRINLRGLHPRLFVLRRISTRI
ncbi:MAG: methyltransferase domain-containing protein [Chloroflexi bacterium]|nr:methyltransferase domain-containing protein [Chloroflexota bacterium]